VVPHNQLASLNVVSSFTPFLMDDVNVIVPKPSSGANSVFAFAAYPPSPLNLKVFSTMTTQRSSANPLALEGNDARLEIHIVAKRISVPFFLIGVLSLFFWEMSGFILVNPLVSVVVCAASVLFYLMAAVSPKLRPAR
jgi:hypothetical protein